MEVRGGKLARPSTSHYYYIARVRHLGLDFANSLKLKALGKYASFGP